MTPEEAQEKAAAMETQLNETKTAIEKAATKEEVTAIEKSISEMEGKFEGLVKNESIDELKAILKTQGEAITAMKANNAPGQGKTVAAQIKEQKDSIRGLANKSAIKAVVLKADTNRASIANNAQATELTDIGQLAHRRLSMYDMFNKIPVSESNNNGTIRYYDWDEDTIVRAAAMVAEGGTFQDSTAKFKTVTLDLKKIGDTLPVTEEFFEDEAMFAAELNQFLTTNVDLIIDNQLANGDGTGNNLKGLVASVGAYNPVASGITDASTYDLIPKVCETITTVGGSKYQPNVAFMNKADINNMKLKKDDNNNYVMPPFVSRDGAVVDGITVIEANVITANTMVIGDSRFARVYEKTGIELSQGMVNAQFTSDEMTLKARKRLLFLIREADAGGWAKVTSISAALTTLAS
tara:strand:+ start:229 stop:1455 length:1227 start_codon:yes stop_codon:yes gene_type:complete